MKTPLAVFLGVMLALAIASLVALITFRQPRTAPAIVWSSDSRELIRRVPAFANTTGCSWAVVLSGTGSALLPAPSTARLLGTCTLPFDSPLLSKHANATDVARGKSLADYLASKGCSIAANVQPRFSEALADTVCDGTSYGECEVAVAFESRVIVFNLTKY